MPTARDEQRRSTHRRVLDSASRLFQEHGYAATTIRAIAEDAGVSPGTVIAVGDKDALLVRVVDAMVEEIHSGRTQRERTGPGTPGATCTERLLALVDPFLVLWTRAADLSRQYAAILFSGAHTSELFASLAETLISEIEEAITLASCSGPDDARPRAEALHAAYVGTLLTAAARPGEIDTDGLADPLRRTFEAICACRETTR